MGYDDIPSDLKELLQVRLFEARLSDSFYADPRPACHDCENRHKHWTCQECYGLIHYGINDAWSLGLAQEEIRLGRRVIRKREGTNGFICRSCAISFIEEWCIQDWEKKRGIERTSIKKYSSKSRTPLSKSVRWRILRRDGFKCVKCGATKDNAELQVDHIVPVSKGGSDEESNLQILCFACNNGKRDS